MNTRIENTGFVIATVSAALVFSGALLASQLASVADDPSTKNSTELFGSISNDSINYADCLWITARNYGFYEIQKDIAQGHANAQTVQLWEQFVIATGQDECGAVPHDIAELKIAMAATEHEADQYFAAR